MTLRLTLAPLWMRLIANIGMAWAVCGAVLIFWRPADPDPPRGQGDWWIAVGVAGPLLGVLMTLAGLIERGKYVAVVKDIAPQEYRLVASALVRGPLPTDPTMRSAVVRLAGLYLKSAERKSPHFGRLSLGMICLWTAMAALQAFDGSANPALILMNLPLWVFYAMHHYYVIPLVEARRALMLNTEGAQV
ncbi:hypothetical protein [Mycobacteroides saopaulense]|uniref:Glycosyl-4,4'-diaponeurosporenoate acyltransferase n=1 Tax=Mycobacteroides saopaulense TaxID=1578165 RepID=A0ABX3BYK4_9MYCO|nr:hypothetical protein [Mycobacteroides saopaulense]OHT86960.1 hypothetical protein BKG68_12850 [Mycobacteroides saopaulense]OHU08816.1 hypothetical protein BKG73_17545 [Mycobacteroides saopaulense]